MVFMIKWLHRQLWFGLSIHKNSELHQSIISFNYEFWIEVRLKEKSQCFDLSFLTHSPNICRASNLPKMSHWEEPEKTTSRLSERLPTTPLAALFSLRQLRFHWDFHFIFFFFFFHTIWATTFSFLKETKQNKNQTKHKTKQETK